MPTLTRRSATLAAIAASLAVPLVPTAFAQDGRTKNKALFQVTDADPAKWALVLNNVKNLQTDLAPEAADVEVVVFGPGIGMLKADSPVSARIAETMKSGVKVVACENTMKNMKLVTADMLPEIGYVPAGVVEVMRKQQQGFAYIRP